MDDLPSKGIIGHIFRDHDSNRLHKGRFGHQNSHHESVSKHVSYFVYYAIFEFLITAVVPTPAQAAECRRSTRSIALRRVAELAPAGLLDLLEVSVSGLGG